MYNVHIKYVKCYLAHVYQVKKSSYGIRKQFINRTMLIENKKKKKRNRQINTDTL